jgi:hypothetical protein
MKFDFIKSPTIIASLLLVLVYVLPFTPYFKNVVADNSDQDNIKEENIAITTQTITGLGMLTGSAKETGTGKNYKEQTGDETKDMNEGYFGPKPEAQKDNKKWKATFGLFDKLSVLVILGAALMVFVGYQTSANQKPLLDEDKMGWVKIIVIGLGLMIFSRYCFFIASTTSAGAGLGAWLSLLSVIVIALESRIMKLMGK